MKAIKHPSDETSIIMPFHAGTGSGLAPSSEGDNDLSKNITEEVFRPIQYLGSKKRSLGFIVDIVKGLQTQPLTVLDIFSGTSIVSQALARAGYSVIATDAMAFCAVFARTFLGVNRPAEGVDVVNLLHLLEPSGTPLQIEKAFKSWADRERRAIKQADSDELLEISTTIPQVWRARHASTDLLSEFEKLRSAEGRPAFIDGSLICTHYAGTYFGITQAIELDRIRVTIERLYGAARINEWERDLLLTTLLSVSSDCAFSPGKHFAQSHLIREGKDLTFIRGRILQDRAINVWERFRARLGLVGARATGINGEHLAFQATFETVIAGEEPLPSFDLIYADPPYTAQQYSRFYHLPETIVKYAVPSLQQHNGAVTRGLYPEERFKSRFCSKRKSPQAFRDLFEYAKRKNASLLISYSDSNSGMTGNDRMISMNQLLELGKSYFGERMVRTVELEHEYRQFNHTDSAVTGRSDKEYLILCERTC